MRTGRLMCIGAMLLMAACCSRQADEPDPTRCLAGGVWNGEKCVPAGCDDDVHCDDGIYCTGAETCVERKCEPGTTPACGDGIHCTDDECDVDLDACVHRPDHGKCSWEQACVPELGGCVTPCGQDSECDDGNFCTDDWCNTDFGACVHEHNQLACDDGSVCTEDDRCSGGVCTGASRECNDSDPCTDDTCDPVDGCRFTPLDRDGDGFVDMLCGGDDCDDGDSDINPDAPEICDGVDNDCDGDTDNKQDSDEQGSICACMTACGGAGAAGCRVGEFCLPPNSEIGRFCVHECLFAGRDGKLCGVGPAGEPRSCVHARPPVVLSLCFCAPECPQYCSTDQECHVYGMDICDSGSCTKSCDDDSNCPYPYGCLGGICGCDPESVQDSCLPTCTKPLDCPDPVDTDPDCLDNECIYGCSTQQPCPEGPQIPDMYCSYYNQMCACAPETGDCLWCRHGDSVCERYGMQCEPFEIKTSDVEGRFVKACTAYCHDDGHCPEGWFCQYGRCIQKGCPCREFSCDPDGGGIDCTRYDLDLCVEEPVNGFLQWACTGECHHHDDCPPGYHCDTDQADPLWLCRCHVR